MGWVLTSSILAWGVCQIGLSPWVSILFSFLIFPAGLLGLVAVRFGASQIDALVRRMRASAIVRRIRKLDAWEAPDEMYEEELNRLRSVDAGLDLAAPLRERLLADGKSRDVLLRYLAARRDVPAIRALIEELAKRGDPLGWRARRWVTSSSG